MSFPMSLNGKVCVITGSASGIGKAIAERYIADGAKVVIADLRSDAAQATATELTAKGAGTAIGVEMIFTYEAAVNAGFQQVIDHWGQIDVLVSNAGIQIVHKLEKFPFDDWKNAVDPSRRRVPHLKGPPAAYV